MDLLRAEGLEIGYFAKGARKSVAKGIRFGLGGGEFVCLLGPNGTGKSTLLRTLAATQPPLAGSILIRGKDLGSLSTLARARMLGLVLTERVDTGSLTARELVSLGRSPYTDWLGRLTAYDESLVDAALQATGSLALAGRKASDLSDGERQKVMIARVLAQETPVILLDEPTAHLDLPNRAGIMRLLKDLARRSRKAILLSTHELDLALQAADQVWLMEPGGRMVIGAPEDLVLGGAFGRCFGQDDLPFDSATGSFRFHDPMGEGIEVVGTGAQAFWTRRALERKGFRTDRGGPNSGLRVRVVQDAGDACHWLCDTEDGLIRVHSIADLLRSLRALPRVSQGTAA